MYLSSQSTLHNFLSMLVLSATYLTLTHIHMWATWNNYLDQGHLAWRPEQTRIDQPTFWLVSDLHNLPRYSLYSVQDWWDMCKHVGQGQSADISMPLTGQKAAWYVKFVKHIQCCTLLYNIKQMSSCFFIHPWKWSHHTDIWKICSLNCNKTQFSINIAWSLEAMCCNRVCNKFT